MSSFSTSIIIQQRLCPLTAGEGFLDFNFGTALFYLSLYNMYATDDVEESF